ncbi:LmeA family phospholipid-binding protein [Granulicoccus sp. GXG6511]|uniref:LmeA family phospholipid-binding protein n=1 Tax=Granulicoccus sp. GXG6511 TaxID=3381351 RepID=UPI003D7F1669
MRTQRTRRSPAGAEERPRRSSGRRSVATLVVVAFVLALLGVGDRLAVRQVEDRVGQVLRTQLDLAEDPSVRIEGIPFLTQVAVNRFDHVRLSGRGIPAGTAERPLLVDRMDLDLRGVRTADRFRRITGERLTGSAGVTWAEVTQQLGATVTPQAGGRVQVDITADLYGQQVPFVISARPVLDIATQRVHLSEPQVIVGSYRIPDDVVQRIAQESVPPVDLSLPMELTASDLRVGRTHLELDLSGADVRLVD